MPLFEFYAKAIESLVIFVVRPCVIDLSMVFFLLLKIAWWCSTGMIIVWWWMKPGDWRGPPLC